MAKYIVNSKTFANGQVYTPALPGKEPTVMEVPDSYVPHFGLEPVDDAAKAAMQQYELVKAGVTTIVDGKKSADPIERIKVKG